MASQDEFLEEDHNRFINSDEFTCWMKDRVLNSSYYKFSGVAPEGFVLVPEVILESLKDSNNWEEFKNQKNYIENKTKEYLRNINP